MRVQIFKITYACGGDHFSETLKAEVTVDTMGQAKQLAKDLGLRAYRIRKVS